MKKATAVFMAISLAAAITGCANINEMNTSSKAGSSSSSVSGQTSSGTASDQTSSGAASDRGTTVSPDETYDAQHQNGDIASNANTNVQSAVSPDETYDAQNQNGEENDAGAGDYDWEGTYASDSGETLTISEIDENTITFAFAVCGIAGTASLDGNTAQFSGDDENVLLFTLTEDYVTVSVTNTAGNPTDGAMMAGTYAVQ